MGQNAPVLFCARIMNANSSCYVFHVNKDLKIIILGINQRFKTITLTNIKQQNIPLLCT